MPRPGGGSKCLCVVICVGMSCVSDVAFPANERTDGVLPGSLGLSLVDIRTGIQQRGHLLHSVDASMTRQFFDGPSVQNGVNQVGGKLTPRREVEKIQLKRKGEKIWGAMEAPKGDDGQPRFVGFFAWDGQRKTGYGFSPDHPEVACSGTVEAKKSHSFRAGYWTTPFEQEVFDLHKPLWEVVKKGQWEIAGCRTIDGSKVVGVRSVGLWNGDVVLTVWVDPAKDFAPREIAFSVWPLASREDRKECTEVMKDVILDRRDGVWVVTAATIIIDNPNLSTVKHQEQRISIDRYRVGVDLDDGIFTIQFPHGTKVWDDITKLSYVVGGPVYYMNKDNLIDGARPGNTLSEISEVGIPQTPTTRGMPQGADTQQTATPAPPVPRPASTGGSTGVVMFAYLGAGAVLLTGGIILLRYAMKGRRGSSS